MTRAFNDVLLVDCETDGISPEVNTVIEIGVVLYSVRHATIRECWSALIKHDSNAAQHVNRIPPAALAGARDREKAMAVLKVFANRADCIIAHSADFDRSFLPDLGKPWACSCHDMDWAGLTPATEQSAIDQPRSRPGKSLVALCLEFGLGVGSAHRAITDCLLLARLFERAAERGHDVNALIERALRPKAKFYAVEGRKGAGNKYDPDRNAIFKQFNFVWNDPDWVRTMAIEDAEFLPFEVKVL